MLPLIMLLYRIDLSLVFLFCAGLYIATQLFGWTLPAEWWTDRPWFFNPLAWQLIFYTGFAFGAKWIRMPPPDGRVFALALGFVILMVICFYSPIWNATPFLHSLSNAFFFGAFKSNFGILRWLHFLCLAYVILYLLHGREQVLAKPIFSPIVKVGQQALVTFMASMTFSWLAGMALDAIGRNSLTWAVINLSGFAMLIATAYVASFVKSEPWRRTPATTLAA
ncbi:MAG: OpgC domain-containing protein [Pseudomonadota bacterium]